MSERHQERRRRLIASRMPPFWPAADFLAAGKPFVGFGPSKEEAEKNALGSCSRIRSDLETCLNSDLIARTAARQKCISTTRARYRDCPRLNQVPLFECRDVYQ